LKSRIRDEEQALVDGDPGSTSRETMDELLRCYLTVSIDKLSYRR